jgi:FKBP-type peptidyl-prolyl cis-trans isomerase 2
LAPGFDLRGVDHRADAGGHAAADVADLVEGRVLADLRHAISGSTVKFEKVEQPM